MTINIIGGFFTPQQTIGGVQLDMLNEIRLLGVNVAGDAAARALIILHELAHLTGRLGEDRDNPQLSKDFNQKLYTACFK